MTTSSLLDLDTLRGSVATLSQEYTEAAPFPHIVLDDVLASDVAERAYCEFSEIPTDSWTNYLHLNSRKYANTDVTTWGPTLQGLAEAFCSEPFVSFLEDLTGFTGLLPDDELDGGGLHRSMPGGFLNVHADFTAHHRKPGWRRRVNLLLYLNPEWKQEWGGQLELWSRDMTRRVAAVEPTGNRMLLFTTDEHSYHGHPDPLVCPAGMARQSLALYYFTVEPDLHPHSTDYRARPGDGARRPLIYLDKKVLQAYDVVKRRLHVSDGFASRVLGVLNRGERAAAPDPSPSDPPSPDDVRE